MKGEAMCYAVLLGLLLGVSSVHPTGVTSAGSGAQEKKRNSKVEESNGKKKRVRCFCFPWLDNSLDEEPSLEKSEMFAFFSLVRGTLNEWYVSRDKK